MIIPVKCFTCGKVLGDKYIYFINQVTEMKGEGNDSVIYFDGKNNKKTPEAKVLDDLNLKRICCRRHMLTHVDID